MSQSGVRLEYLAPLLVPRWTTPVKRLNNDAEEYNEVRPDSEIGDRTPLSLIHLPRQPAEAPDYSIFLIISFQPCVTDFTPSANFFDWRHADECFDPYESTQALSSCSGSS